MLISFCSFLHLFRLFKVGKYSLTQRFQNVSINICDFLHSLLTHFSSGFILTGGQIPLDESIMKWLGVVASKNEGSVDIFVRWRELTIFSASTKIVESVSSRKLWPNTIFQSYFFTEPINLFQVSPIWVLDGEINLNSIPFELNVSIMDEEDPTSYFAASYRSFVAPLMFVPLSHNIVFGLPRLEIILLITIVESAFLNFLMNRLSCEAGEQNTTLSNLYIYGAEEVHSYICKRVHFTCQSLDCKLSQKRYNGFGSFDSASYTFWKNRYYCSSSIYYPFFVKVRWEPVRFLDVEISDANE